MEILFRPFQTGDEPAFRVLNEAWIGKYFVIEEEDRRVLADPVNYVLKPGGYIYFGIHAGEAICCCALLAIDGGGFEVAKMTVSERYRGQGIGQLLLAYVIGQARAMGAARLYLETNWKLANAIHVYEALGFRHLPADRAHPSPYTRANVFMELVLEGGEAVCARASEIAALR